MLAVLMLGLLWTASARLTEEQDFRSTGVPPVQTTSWHGRPARAVLERDAQTTLRGTGVPPVRSLLERDAQATPRGVGVPARAVLERDARAAPRGTGVPARAVLERDAQATIRLPAEATVHAPRFRLGDIATIETEDPALREQLAQIELGASPLAGQTRVFTKQQLLTRLRQHKVDISAIQIEMPDTVRLTRAAQTLDVPQLEQFARAQLKTAVGDTASEWTLENPPAPASLPSGAVEFRLEGAPRVASGSATMEITALVEGQPRAKYLLRFKAPQKARQITVRSGESVQVRVMSGGVVLEVRGVARATGAVDEIIPIYIPDTQKTIRAQIVESGVVEVRL